jgi:hypothetical protein
VHRANLTPAQRQAIVDQLLAAGLLNPADEATFPGGLINGVFPPVLNDNSACPHLPQTFDAAPGSNFGSHHSYPGALPAESIYMTYTRRGKAGVKAMIGKLVEAGVLAK